MKNLAAVFILILLISVAEAQQSTIDSLKHELTIAKEDANKVRQLTRLSYLYIQSSVDTGAAYAQKALDLSEKINFEVGILGAEFSLATISLFSGNYPLALDHGFKYLSLAKKIHDTVSAANANGLLGECYYELGEYNTSLKYCLESLKLGEAIHTDQIYFAQVHMAYVYQGLNQPDSAILYAKKAYEKLKGIDMTGSISNTLGDAYAGKVNYDSALFNYRNGLSLSLKAHIVLIQVDSYNGIAGVYKATNNFDSAAWYSKKVLAEKIEKSYPIGLFKAANMLADIYESQNKPDSSLKYLRLALTIKDSLFGREKTNAIQNIAFKEQEKQKEIEASELKYQNRLRTHVLLGGLIALLVIGVILLRNNRNKQKAYTLLQSQKQETDQQKSKAEQALRELKSTQNQLIQSEKMASLGELTAGIAHEIQNPLNFVNNFSEVNKELLMEMKNEIDKGNTAEAKSIADDVIENEQKINHHGRRADGIVKGMLQHSRASSGQKELTNINALADEYLRLSYHGMRAKDKSFNAEIKTDFDRDLSSVEGKINIIPQDIGRVLLNLYNNAFYATNEKKKADDDTFKPIISVRTKKINGKIEIRVEDNGAGIPQNIVDKIFQPFFTTKPTGQGTGLGLSLSYDIIKAHGGEIKAQNKQGEGVEFILELPS